jgi:hypothetical protein
MKVIGAGFGRTGTMSLKVALEELGFGPCYHMVELFDNPAHLEPWAAAAQGEPVDWKQLLGSYQATVDWPACTFYEELMEAYPDAKVLLSVRDPKRWYESTLNTIYGATKLSTAALMFSVMGLVVPTMKRSRRIIDDIIWEGTFDGNFEDRRYAIEVFNRHNEEVKRRVPVDRLLVYEVKDGWDPLCEFLNVEVPEDKPFPHLNDAAAFRNMLRRRLVLASAVPVVGALLAGLALFYLLTSRRS